MHVCLHELEMVMVIRRESRGNSRKNKKILKPVNVIHLLKAGPGPEANWSGPGPGPGPA